MADEKCAIDVLLVENDKDQAELFREALRETNSKIVMEHADSVPAAREALQRCVGGIGLRPPLIVLLDIDLPPHYGLDLLRSIRASSNPQIKVLPVIVFSGSADNDEIWKAYALGANSFITKPLGWDRTCRIVELLEAFWCSARLPTR